MARKKKSSGEPPNPMSWMVTFSDMVTLLLTFFVLLISMSSMDVKAVSQAFTALFDEGSGPMELGGQGRLQDLARIISSVEQIPDSVLLDRQSEVLGALFDFQDVEFQNMMNLVDRDIQIRKDERGLVIQLADYILFDEGSAEIHYDYLPVLTRLADILRATGHAVSVEGHTDDTVLEGETEAWAWELSLERAIAVMEYFTVQEGLNPDRFRVGGYGPSRPLGPNDSPVNRAKNRRIEIVLYREKFS